MKERVDVVTVVWNGLGCRLETNLDKLIPQLDQSRKSLLGRGCYRIVDGSKLDGIPYCEYSVRYLHQGGRPPSLEVEGNTLLLIGSWDRVGTEQITCLLLIAFEHANMARSRFMIHSSAVSLGDRGYLFSGARRSGKTTIAVELCRRLGARLISNDHTELGLVDGCQLVYPTAPDVIYVRSDAVYQSDPELYVRLYGERASGPVADARMKLTPEGMGIECEGAEVPLERFYYVGLGQTEDLESYPYAADELRIALYEDLSSTIRGVSLCLFDPPKDAFGPFIPDLSTPETDAAIMGLADALIAENRIWAMRGPLDLVVQEILSHARRST